MESTASYLISAIDLKSWFPHEEGRCCTLVDLFLYMSTGLVSSKVKLEQPGFSGSLFKSSLTM